MVSLDFNISDDYNVCHMEKKAKPLCFVGDDLLIYRGGDLFLMDLNDFTKTFICSFGLIKKHEHLARSRLLTRLLRLEPRGVVKIDENNILLSIRGGVYHFNLTKKHIQSVHRFRQGMNAPLSLTAIKNIEGFRERYCYGEYFANPKKKPVSIYGCNEEATNWHEVYRFGKGQVNHIHSIIPDFHQNRVWIFTGDYGDAASIWYTENDFETIIKYRSGSQQFRACVGFPTREGLIYATDTPQEDNNIYLISKDNRLIRLFGLEGSSIYSTSFKGKLLLSTAVEGYADGSQGKAALLSYKRGKGIKSWNCDMVIGNLSEGFEKVATFKKDLFPMGLMQFGTITFPVCDKEADKIIFYGKALKKIDDTLLIMSEKRKPS